MGLDSAFRKLEIEAVTAAYRHAKGSRVFFLDNEGTLAPDLRALYSRVSNTVEAQDVHNLQSHGERKEVKIIDNYVDVEEKCDLIYLKRNFKWCSMRSGL
jgi:trehalose 6-phosphate synthase/phosphatase